MIIKIFTLALFLIAPNSFSQPTDSPITLVEKPTKKLQDVGVMIGFGQNYSNGEHYVDCEGCFFDGGVSFGTTLGIYYEREINNWFWYGGLIRYDILGIESKYIENESVDVLNSNKTFVIPFEQKAILDLSYLNFTPYVSIRPFSWMRINTGLNFGFNLSSNIKHTKTPINNEVIDPQTGDIYEIEVTNPDPNKTGSELYTLMDAEMPNLASPYYTLFLNLSFPIEFDNESKLIPSMGFDLPLTKISDYGNNFNIGTWRIFLGFSYPLVTRGKENE